MEQGGPSIEQMESWVREVVDRHGDDGDRFAFSGILEDRDRLRGDLATAREVIQESMEARRVTEEVGGPLNQANNEIDRLRARVAELEAIELSEDARGILATHGSDGTLTICGEFANGREFRSKYRVRTPAPDVVPVPREELEVLRDGFGLLRTVWNRFMYDQRIDYQVGVLIERHDALRSGEVRKGGER